VAVPGVAEPGAAVPGAAVPGAAEPRVAVPGVAEPMRSASRGRAPIAVSPGRMRRESGAVPAIRFPRWERAPGEIAAKLCVDPGGAVSSVTVLSPVSRGVRATVEEALSAWRYRPFREGDEPVSVCFATSFRVRVEK
jgi:hypothetical protein